MFNCCCTNNAARSGQADDLGKILDIRDGGDSANDEADLSSLVPGSLLASLDEAAARAGGKAAADAGPRSVTLLSECIEFEQLLERNTDGSVGVKISMWPVGLQVQHALRATVVGSPPATMEKHDFIVAVGGVNVSSGVEGLQRALGSTAARSSPTVEMRIVRPSRRRVLLEKRDRVGLKLGYQGESTCLRVKEVVDGSALDFNKRMDEAGAYELVGSEVPGYTLAPQDAKIRVNDFIESVNGIVGNAESLCKAMKDATELELGMLRLSSEC